MDVEMMEPVFDAIEQTLETTELTPVEHPFFTTPFAEYSVTEGFLLLLFLAVVLYLIFKFFKGEF